MCVECLKICEHLGTSEKELYSWLACTIPYVEYVLNDDKWLVGWQFCNQSQTTDKKGMNIVSTCTKVNWRKNQKLYMLIVAKFACRKKIGWKKVDMAVRNSQISVCWWMVWLCPDFRNNCR